MAKREYTAYQKNVIRNFYENKGTILVERIQTAMSDLFLAATPKKQDALWERIFTALEQTAIHRADIDYLKKNRDIHYLGELIKQLF